MIAVKYAPAKLLKTRPLRVTYVVWNWLFSCNESFLDKYVKFVTLKIN